MENIFVRCVINDILSTGCYSLSGIAYYTNIPEEVIQDLAMGVNTSPSIVFLRNLLELHRSVRKELYEEVMKKIAINLYAAA